MNGRHTLYHVILFGTGILASNRIKHATANFLSEKEVPYIKVAYNKNGAFANGQRVDPLTGVIGGARCDWVDLSTAQRDSIVSKALREDVKYSVDIVRNLNTEDQMNVVYTGLVQLARKAGTSVEQEVERMKGAIGYRWETRYDQNDLPFKR